MLITLSLLQAKEVVLIHEGERIGFIDDVEIDVSTGHITSIVVHRSPLKSSFIFQRQEEIVIPWEQIVTIGQDVILVTDGSKKVDESREK